MIDWILKHGTWVLPYNPYARLLNRQRRREAALRFERAFGHMQRLAASNAALKCRHQGQRAFILCNGPSTLEQNLQPLASEFVFSVSSGYLHRDYDKIKPRYHCVPQITYGRMTEQDVVAWFREMHQRIGSAEVFLSATEENLVRAHDLFPGRTLHYLFLHEDFDRLGSRNIPDISATVPGVQSVPIMGLIVGLYMGFKDLYLLGTEHSEFVTRRYRYSFEPTVLKGKDLSTTPAGEVTTSRYDDFQSLGRLWRQYRALREIAQANNARIWNATAGGELDEFPRVPLEQVVGP
ncbi:MAG TPA: hypothetical protein VJ750_13805 [Rhizomicrobium sp.]|nr:hypothetical protein [Rhizomicrobium sp.]